MSVYAFRYEMSAHLRVTDEDAADFLQSQFSNELRPFAEGQTTYGLWLDVKGKIVADSWVRCLGEEEFLVLSENSSAQVIFEKLERHIIADDVEIEILPSVPALVLVGDQAAGIACEAGDVAQVFEGNRSLLPSVELVFTSEADRESFIERHNLEFVSEEWIQKERIKAGIPLVPTELGPDDLPGEGGMERFAVSFTKGCFLGQEVVARMHNVGRPQRALFQVSGSGVMGELPLLLSDEAGKSAGELRSVFRTDSGWIGVAILKKRRASEGSRLFADSCEVTVERSLDSEH